MCSNRTLPRLLVMLVVAVPLCLGALPAAAGTLRGQLVDSMTGTPISGASVRVAGTQKTTTTDEKGHWSFELPEGEYELEFEKRLGGKHYEFRLVNQHVPQYKPADSRIATSYYLERGAERLERPIGAPTARIPHPSNRDRGTVEIGRASDPSETFRPGASTIPEKAPRTIRVARRDQKDNCDNPIVAIEEMTLDEYVRGVLPPEIGVFRNLDNVGEVYRAFGLAAKSYGLYFMLVYDADNRRPVQSPKPPHDYTWFHIDDTPCNQRYSDRRLTVTDEAAAATDGELLVKKGAPRELDKYEYAASCAGHGTRPEYQQEIIPDESPARACVGDWCGHEDCAGHEDHPGVPGQDRCLVRGFCQWGAAEWAKGGKEATWLLDHYQPNLQRHRIWGDSTPETVAVKGYVHTDSSNPTSSGVADARVELDVGEETTTDGTGRFAFSDIELSRGSITLRATKPGYRPRQKSATLEAGQTNWVNLRLEPRDVSNPDANTDTTDTGTNRRDAAGTASDGGGNSTNARPYGGLGPLVTRSTGARRDGCSMAADRRGVPAETALLLGAALVGGLAMGRRRS